MNPIYIARMSLAFSFVMPVFAACNANNDSQKSLPQQNAVTREVEVEIGEDQNAALLLTQKALALLFVQSAQAQVSDIKLCIQKLRFKKLETRHAHNASHSRTIEDSPSHDGPGHDMGDDNGDDTIEFNLGLINMDATGAKLGKVDLPVGDYRRVEIELSASCSQGSSTNNDFSPSIELVNDNGRFSTNNDIKFRFDGNFSVKEESSMPQKLGLAFTELKQDLDEVNSVAELERLTEKRNYSVLQHQ